MEIVGGSPTSQQISEWAEGDASNIGRIVRQTGLLGRVSDPERLHIPPPNHYFDSPDLPARRVASAWPAFDAYREARTKCIAGETEVEPKLTDLSPLYEIGQGAARLKLRAGESDAQECYAVYLQALLAHLEWCEGVSLIGTHYENRALVSYDFDGDPSPRSGPAFMIYSLYAYSHRSYFVRDERFELTADGSPSIDERLVQRLLVPRRLSRLRRYLRTKRPLEL
jgi:hypothetical protein